LKTSQIKKVLNAKKKIELALPIKTKDGRLVKNALEIDDEDEDDHEEDRASVDNESSAEVPEKDEKEHVESNKSIMDIIREKKEQLDKNKEKIAYLSRQVIENPQEQVRCSFN
jgi:hypothetical protein